MVNEEVEQNGSIAYIVRRSLSIMAVRSVVSYLVDKVQGLETELQNSRQQLEAQKEEARLVKLQSAEAQNKLVKGLTTVQSTKEKALEEKLVNLQKELDELQKQWQAAEKSNVFLKQQKLEDAAKIAQMEQLQQRKLESIGELSGIVSRLQHELKRAEEELQLQLKVRERAQQDAAEVRQRAVVAENELGQLKTELDAILNDKWALMNNVELLNHELHEITKANEKKRATHQKTFSAAIDHAGDLKKELRERSLAHEKRLQQVLVLQGQVTQLKKQLKTSEAEKLALASDIEFLQHRLHDVQKENELKSLDHEKASQEAIHCRDVMIRELVKAKDEQKILTEEMEQLKSKMKAMEETEYQALGEQETCITTLKKTETILRTVRHALDAWQEENEVYGAQEDVQVQLQVEHYNLNLHQAALIEYQEKLHGTVQNFLSEVEALQSQVFQRQCVTITPDVHINNLEGIFSEDPMGFHDFSTEDFSHSTPSASSKKRKFE